MTEITITFTCDPNIAALLMTVYDLVGGTSKKNFCVFTVDNFEWLIDELTGIAPEVEAEKLAQDGQEFKLAAKALVEFERQRRTRFDKKE